MTVPMHLQLRDAVSARLDERAAEHDCSRSALIQALIMGVDPPVATSAPLERARRSPQAPQRRSGAFSRERQRSG